MKTVQVLGQMLKNFSYEGVAKSDLVREGGLLSFRLLGFLLSAFEKQHNEAIDFISKKYPNLPVIIYGRSLGTGFATRLASRRIASGLVLETPFFNLIDVARAYLPFFPVDTLIRYKMRSDLYLSHVDYPVHIFHGTKDKVVRYSSAFKLFSSLRGKGNVQMTTLVGGKHGNLNTFPLFRERLSTFFSEVLLLNSHRSA